MIDVHHTIGIIAFAIDSKASSRIFFPYFLLFLPISPLVSNFVDLIYILFNHQDSFD